MPRDQHRGRYTDLAKEEGARRRTEDMEVETGNISVILSTISNNSNSNENQNKVQLKWSLPIESIQGGEWRE